MNRRTMLKSVLGFVAGNIFHYEPVHVLEPLNRFNEYHRLFNCNLEELYGYRLAAVMDHGGVFRLPTVSKVIRDTKNMKCLFIAKSLEVQNKFSIKAIRILNPEDVMLHEAKSIVNLNPGDIYKVDYTVTVNI